MKIETKFYIDDDDRLTISPLIFCLKRDVLDSGKSIMVDDISIIIRSARSNKELKELSELICNTLNNYFEFDE